MVARAAPLPPPELGAGPIEVTVPITFSLR